MSSRVLKRRSLLKTIIGIAVLFSVIIVLLFGCGYAILAYHLKPNITISFTADKGAYEKAEDVLISFARTHKMRHVTFNNADVTLTFRAVDMGNSHIAISSHIYLHYNKPSRDVLTVSFNKSRIPGLRPSDAQMEVMVQEFIDSLTAIDGVDLKKIEYFDRKRDLVRTKGFEPEAHSKSERP